MLQYLHVKNLALIDEIEVEFGRGLNILTGETGAGKSIILGSVNLALGGRYTKDILRQGARYGLVELTFSVENERQIRKLKELDIYPEDGFITLQRRLMEGRSVSKINGETVQMATLKAVSSILIDIHGQHEHQSLLYKKNHLAIVDAFAGEETKRQKEKVVEIWRQYKEKQKELSEAGADESERAKELAFLQFEVDEIVQAELKEHEDEELESLYRRMCNGKRIVQSETESYQNTGGDGESASEKLGRALRTLSEVSDADEQLAQLYSQLADVDNLLNERFLGVLSTKENVNLQTLGFSEETVKGYQAIITPIDIAGERLGTLFIYKKDKVYEIDDIILSEYGTTVVGLEMLRSVNEESAEETRKEHIVQSAISTLSYSELEAIIHIFDELDGAEGILVASKIADRVGITRSVIVNALRKFESAGVIESRSSGMKGTYIKVINDYVFTELERIKAERTK